MFKNNMLNEWKLDPKSFYLDFREKCKTFDLDKKRVKFYSQQDEDKYIIQYFLKQKISDGTYLEAGATDGITHSNTKTLEDHFGFRGVLIEPQKEFYEKLVKNRPNNECYNYAITSNDISQIEFCGHGQETGGIKNTLRIKFDSPSYMVKTKRLSDILRESKFNHIDFMIIDVEGHELEFLKSIDFTFPIFCIIIEAASDQMEKNKIFGKFLSDNGFTFIERQRGNEVWVNLDSPRKDLFNVKGF